ncbi:MAG: Holliday junction branch migration protein RuvA [Candidatus Omnitrophota bacterium]
MIAQISGRLIEKRNNSILLENNGICYEVFLPVVHLGRIEEAVQPDGLIKLITYHYYHLEPSKSIPILIGFLNEIEKDFFETFITVSGIGPKAALRAINTPISQIAKAIDETDIEFLRSLPGIGSQRAKEIIAKLQGKIGKFGLLQDTSKTASRTPTQETLLEEAIKVLMQLQYKKHEAKEMVAQALTRKPDIKNLEDLLNIVYKQKITKVS